MIVETEAYDGERDRACHARAGRTKRTEVMYADPQWGEIPIAFVVAVPGATLTAAQLVDHCKPLLGFKTPRIFRFIDAMPKNANGKVDKPKLNAQALTLGEAENV